MTQSRTLVTLLAFASMYFAILMPPEAYPAGMMAVVLTATFAFLIALAERKIPSTYLLAGIALFTTLVVHTVLLSVDPGRSLEFLPVVWAYYCLLGYFRYSDSSLTQFAAAVVVLSVIVSCYGIYQYFWGFEQLYDFISQSGTVNNPALTTIESKRVFSTLALPGTLWGFLVLALPIHGILWKKRRVLDAALFGSASLLVWCGLLTRSFGFLVGLFVLATSALVLRYRAVLWNRVLTLVVIFLILALLGAVFYSVRQEAIDLANPFSLRVKSWAGAWNIFAVNPLGTGLNTFAVVYPQVMQPGANETQYAHNTPLQVMSELGFCSVFATMVFIVYIFQTRRAGQFTGNTTWLVLALIVWLFHNFIDINVYFPSLGVMGAVLTGLILSRPRTESPAPPGYLVAAISSVAVCALLLAGPVFISAELQHRARIELETGKLAESITTLDMATKFNPLNSSLYQVTGETALELFQQTQKQEYLHLARGSFQKAVELSPLKAGPRIGLGLCFATSSQMEDALREIEIAERLYPNSLYIRSIETLMQRRIRGEFSN